MLQALRYVEAESHSSWEVRTEAGFARCPDLGEFLQTQRLFELAVMAHAQSGRWKAFVDLPPKIGEVLRLKANLVLDIPAGLWCVFAVRWGNIIDLHRIGADEDGHPCVTHRGVMVLLEEMQQFVPLSFNIYEDAITDE